MSDLSYLIEIILKARDQATPTIEKVKKEIEALKATQDAESGEKDLSKALDERGRKEDEAARKTAAGTRAKKDSQKATQDAADSERDVAKAHDERVAASDRL